MRFFSDNNASACPEIMAAIAAANYGLAKGYGDDAWSARLDAVFGEFFGARVSVFPVSTGTAANCLALATLTPPWGAVFTHDESHLLRSESSAPEFYSGGARFIPLPSSGAKLAPATLRTALEAHPVSVQTVQPAAVSITQSTELGTVYSAEEIAALAEVAHAAGLALHMDGARFANAVVAQNAAPADLTWRAGVDVLSFGATKNGALTAEAAVFFHPPSDSERSNRSREFELRRKRGGHLLSKSRFMSAQLLAYLETGAWRRNAERANRLAAQLAAAAAPWLLHPVEANQLFLALGEAAKSKLREQGFGFYDWGAPASGGLRLVVSWDQDERDVAALASALAALPATSLSADDLRQ